MLFAKKSSLFLPLIIGAGSVVFLFLFLFISKIILVFWGAESYFAAPTSQQILRAGCYSLIYDAYVAAHFLLPMAVLLFLPVNGKWYLKSLSFLICFILCVLCLLTAGDVVFSTFLTAI